MRHAVRSHALRVLGELPAGVAHPGAEEGERQQQLAGRLHRSMVLVHA
jgi:hypothetical protein